MLFLNHVYMQVDIGFFVCVQVEVFNLCIMEPVKSVHVINGCLLHAQNMVWFLLNYSL